MPTPIYTVSVKTNFTARHFLFGGDFGEENQPHSHPYRLEFRVSGPTLNRHGFLVDIVEMENALNRATAYFGGRLLNDLPEFEGLNPSVENFARILCHRLAGELTEEGLAEAEAVLWESETAFAACRMHLLPEDAQ